MIRFRSKLIIIAKKSPAGKSPSGENSCEESPAGKSPAKKSPVENFLAGESPSPTDVREINKNPRVIRDEGKSIFEQVSFDQL